MESTRQGMIIGKQMMGRTKEGSARARLLEHSGSSGWLTSGRQGMDAEGSEI